jgi:hypothetical protein
LKFRECRRGPGERVRAGEEAQTGCVGVIVKRKRFVVSKPTLQRSGQKLAESAEKIKDSTYRVEDSAERTTQLAADRTVFAAERTYAAWVRTGLLPLVALAALLGIWFGRTLPG